MDANPKNGDKDGEEAPMNAPSESAAERFGRFSWETQRETEAQMEAVPENAEKGGANERKPSETAAAAAAIEVTCSQCGAGEYQVVDVRTGEVMCKYCRNKWIVPALAHKTETEKYLAEQAKRPRVLYDNTPETEKQMMTVVSGLSRLLNFNPLRSLGWALRRLFRKILFVIAVAIVALAAFVLFRFYFWPNL
jgi:uncharacterized Zn finger protein (UPF0148 family)